MVDNFNLDPAFANQELKIGELNLCYLLLSDNALFPWVILVPKRNNIKEIIDLDQTDQYLLIDEINLVSQTMKELFIPDKLNVAALGNIVSQLHIHIIARYKNDKAWPYAVFGKEDQKYNPVIRKEIISRIQDSLTLKTSLL